MPLTRVVPFLLGVILLAGCSSSDEPSRTSIVAADGAHQTFIGASPGDHLSANVAADFDADGRLDVALASTGADGPDGFRADAGEVRIVFDIASLGAEVDLAAPDGSSSLTFHGPFPGAALGRGLAVGDFNGDSIADLAMSAPLGIDPALGTESPGIVYVQYGSPEVEPGNIDLLSASMPVTIRGVDAGDGAGLTLLAASVDGDNIDDLVVGAHIADGFDNQSADAGEAYVLAGDQLTAEISLAEDSRTTLVGTAAGDHLSEAMESGDFNSDGASDLAIAATFAEVEGNTQSGLTYVLPSPLAPGTIGVADAESLLSIGGADAGDQLGHSIAAGDRDNDGADDLWLGSVSADGPDNSEDLAGEALLFLVDANLNGFVSLIQADALILGPSAVARLGRNAASSQFDGEPGDDLAIAATDVDDRRGAVYVVPAGQPVPERADEAWLTLKGRSPDDILGHEAFGNPSIGSVQFEDQPADLVVAAPSADGPDGSRPDCGEIYLVRIAEVTD